MPEGSPEHGSGVTNLSECCGYTELTEVNDQVCQRRLLRPQSWAAPLPYHWLVMAFKSVHYSFSPEYFFDFVLLFDLLLHKPSELFRRFLMPFVRFSDFAIVLSVTRLVPLDSPGGQKRCRGQCQDLAAGHAQTFSSSSPGCHRGRSLALRAWRVAADAKAGDA